MKPVCVPCERFMRVKTNGYYFIEGMPHSAPEPWDGNAGKGSVGWAPYKVWVGDLWECPTCGTQTIAGVNRQPVAEHFEPAFPRFAVLASLTVKDC